MSAEGRPSVDEAARLTCRTCGTENEAGRSFCSSCGDPLSAAKVEAASGAESRADQGWRPPPLLKRALVLIVIAAVAVIVVNAILSLRGDGGSTLTTQASAQPTDSTEEATTAETDAAGGEPTRLRADAITADASSVLPPVPDEGLSYGPENVLDGDLATAWNDGSSGSGVGESLTFRFASPIDLVEIEIVNGYAKSGDIYAANARVRRANLITDESASEIELTDVMSPQTIEGPFGTTSSVVLEVLSVYPGDTYEDLAISEIVFWVSSAPDQEG